RGRVIPPGGGYGVLREVGGWLGGGGRPLPGRGRTRGGCGRRPKTPPASVSSGPASSEPPRPASHSACSSSVIASQNGTPYSRKICSAVLKPCSTFPCSPRAAERRARERAAPPPTNARPPPPPAP